MSYRILSLDGGGAWALIEVLALKNIFGDDATGHEILGHFDLAIANSGGSLVLGGLAENRSLTEIENFFLDATTRESIFAPGRWFQRKLNAWLGIGARFSTDQKYKALSRLYEKRGALTLDKAAEDIVGPSDKPLRLVIVAYDYDRNRATFFRSSARPNGSSTSATAGVTLAQAMHASTNAPVNYFDQPAAFGTPLPRYWDGGITGNNNPVLAGVTEALYGGAKPHDIRALSIGTGTVVLPPRNGTKYGEPFVRPTEKSGLKNNIMKLAKSTLGDPPDAAPFIAHVMTGQDTGLPQGIGSRVVRLNPLIRPILANGSCHAPGGWSDDEFRRIRDMDMDGVAQDDVRLIEKYARVWISNEPINQPIRLDGTTLECEIGTDRYEDATASWRHLMLLS